MVIPKEMRKEGWVALWVAGDGNCAWRSLARCLWETDEFWAQLKLVVLAWAAANAEDLVSEGRILSDFTKYYSSDIHGAFAVTANRLGDAATVADKSKMLIASVADFSKPACWGGDLTMLLASQALRITVKLVCPIDMMSRKRDEASATLETDRGSSRKDNINPEDSRHSQTFLPDDAVSSLRVGGGDRTVTEATVILTSSCTQASAGELDSLVEVTKATTCYTGCHFAAVSKKDRSTPPFPLVRAAPPLFQALVSGYTPQVDFLW